MSTEIGLVINIVVVGAIVAYCAEQISKTKRKEAESLRYAIVSDVKFHIEEARRKLDEGLDRIDERLARMERANGQLTDIALVQGEDIRVLKKEVAELREKLAPAEEARQQLIIPS